MTRHVIIARNTAAGKWVLQIENLKEKSARRSSDWHGGSTTCRKTNLKGRTIATDTFHQKIKNDGDMLLLFLFRFLRFLTELSLWFVDRVSRNWTFRYRSVDWILQRLFQKVSDIGIAKKKEKKRIARNLLLLYISVSCIFHWTRDAYEDISSIFFVSPLYDTIQKNLTFELSVEKCYRDLYQLHLTWFW